MREGRWKTRQNKGPVDMRGESRGSGTLWEAWGSGEDVKGIKGLRGLVFAETKLWLPRLEGREVFRGTEFSACPLLPGDERKMQTGTHRVLGLPLDST